MSKIVAFVASCLLGALAGTAQGALPPSSASVAASSYAPRANPALTFKLTYEMQCGSPGAGPLVVQLPSAMSVPVSIAPSSVLVNGAPAASVKVKGSKLTVGIPQKGGFITCDVIGMGTLTVVVTRSAGLHNPKAKGIYGFRVAIGPLDVAPKYRIS